MARVSAWRARRESSAVQSATSQVSLLRPRPRAVSLFFRALATLIESGVPIHRALGVLSQGGDDPRMAEVAMGLAVRVAQGTRLSGAMMCYPRAFTRFQCRMVRVGEGAGVMDGILRQIADYEEDMQTGLMKVRAALTYPMVVLVLSVTLLVFGTPYLLHGQFQMIRESGVPAPWITRVVMQLSDMARDPLVLGLCALLLGALGALLRRPRVRREILVRALSLPKLGRMLRLLAVARFARTLQVQLNAGINIRYALPVAAETSDHPLLMERGDLALKAVEAGRSLCQSLRLTGFFPKDFLECVRVGEQVGRVPDLLTWLARSYDDELDAATGAFVETLEPLMMLLMGGIVTLLMLATMLPMVQVLQTL